MKEYIHGGDIYRHPDVLDFSANINPLGTPSAVVQAAKDSMEWICHYPDACQEKLKQALAAYEQVPVEWLICETGAELIFALVQAVNRNGRWSWHRLLRNMPRHWKPLDVRWTGKF